MRHPRVCGSLLRRPPAGRRGVRGRRTCRANVVIRLIGYALGGRPGERLARRIGLSVSNDTLLRWVKRCAQPVTAEARVIGIDEWAKRKRHTYGTIVVDLEQHTVSTCWISIPLRWSSSG